MSALCGWCLRTARDHRQPGAIARVADQIGINRESLRNLVRQAEIDGGLRPGMTTAEQLRIAELERENRELRRATPPDPGLPDELKTQVRQVMTTGTAATRKALLRELVAEIRVEDRHTIRPWFWVPDGTLTANRQVTPESPVRNLADQVDPTYLLEQVGAFVPAAGPRKTVGHQSPPVQSGSTKRGQ